MDLTEKTPDQMDYEELRKTAKELGVKLPPGVMNIDHLRGVVKDAALERQIRKEMEVRNKLKKEAEIRQGIVDIEAQAQLANVTVTIPDNPTLVDIVRLKKELGMKIKEPKPSPEALAIQKSKKIYATFRNLESRGVDVPCLVGGHRFHFWPGRKHVIPEWIIGYCQRQCVSPVYERVTDPVTGSTVSKLVRSEPRFLWEVHGDAPVDAPFGVVIQSAVAV